MTMTNNTGREDTAAIEGITEDIDALVGKLNAIHPTPKPPPLPPTTAGLKRRAEEG